MKLIAFLAALPLVALAGILGALATTASASGETTSDTTGTTTTSTDGTTTLVEPDPPADMPLADFRERRRDKLHRVNTIRWRKGYHRIHIRRSAAEIAPTRRSEVLAAWRERVQKARERPRVGVRGHRWRYYDRNFHHALRLASRVTGVSYRWLHGCDHSEGSDQWIYNHQGSGAFGPMQFMSGTFYGNVDAAFYYARHHGAKGLPGRYKKWNSGIGQAMTAAYMFKIGQSGQWTGGGC